MARAGLAAPANFLAGLDGESPFPRMHACTMGAASEARQCFTFYKARETQGLGETSQRLLLVLEKLEQFSG